MPARRSFLILAAAAIAALSSARLDAGRPLFTTAFPPDEFAARRARVFERIGDAVAIVQGAAEYPAYVRFRQNNQFFYLTGVEVPRALVLLDGRSKTTTLFLSPRNERLERSEGPVLTPGSEAERLTAIADVRPRGDFEGAFKKAVGKGRTVYTCLRAESLGASTPQAARSHAEATTADPWDGRPSREQAFVAKLQAAAPHVRVEDLDPVLDSLRLIKSSREIGAVREATHLAGLAMMEAMRSARPGLREHQIEALGNFLFTLHGAQGIAYFALVATGQNASYPHYHAGTDVLRDGDLVLFDYAPDVNYYTSDVTRMFPAAGRFSPVQRLLYTTYLRMYTALMESIRPNAAPRDILRAATMRMDRIVETTSFPEDRYRRAAADFVERLRVSTRNSLGHFVGMDVHDVTAPYDVLRPGMVFTIEPALTVPDERIYIRLEDVIVVTDTGYENLSAFVPADVDEIERLMTEPGMLDSVSDMPATR
jgi:Xaa-Pro aminopeptidase